jgi:hypothetical protein
LLHHLQLIDWKNLMAELILVLATAMTGGATIVLAYFTWLLREEGRKQREISTRPDIGLYLQPDRLSHNTIYLVIVNTGQGSAYDIVFALDPPEAGWIDGSNIRRKLKDIAWLGNGMEFLPASSERRLFFAPANYWKDGKVILTVSYDRSKVDRPSGPARSSEFTESFTLDLDQFEGQLFTDPAERKVHRALETIGKELHGIESTLKKVTSAGAAGGKVIRPENDPNDHNGRLVHDVESH